jgi:hypothetical protein
VRQSVQVAHGKQMTAGALHNIFCAANARLNFAKLFMPHWNIVPNIAHAFAVRAVWVAQGFYQIFNLG